MKNYIVLSLVILLSVLCLNEIRAQNENHETLPQRTAEKLKKKFSKRAFIKSIEELRLKYEETVVRTKNYTDDSGKNIYKDDQELIKAYSETQDAFNEVLDTMINDINKADNIFEYHLFDANTRYREQLTAAKETGDNFIQLAEQKLSGDTKFIGNIIQWIIKIWPIIKKIENIYLDHVKAIMNDKLKNTKLRDWAEIEFPKTA